MIMIIFSWEYPGTSGGRPTDKSLFTVLIKVYIKFLKLHFVCVVLKFLLIKELKEEFAAQGFLLTAAVGVGKYRIDNGYEVAEISKSVFGFFI